MPLKKIVTSTKAVGAEVENNTRHISENTSEIRNNTKMIHLLYGIIIVLMMIIAGLAFYVGTLFNGGGNTNTPVTAQVEDIQVTILDDTRCSECQTATIVSQIKALPFLAGATFIEQDFSESGVAEYMETNSITKLPAVIFNTNILGDGGQIAPYLAALPGGEFSLALDASFDPYAKRSDKGFLMLEGDLVTSVLAGSYFKGNPEAEITWLEYTDINCHFCQKMEDDGTADTVLEKFPDTLNKVTHNFIGVGGQKSQIGAEILECIGKEAGADAYNSVLAKTLTGKDSSEAAMLELATAEGVNAEVVKACLDNGDMKPIVTDRFTTGQEVFGVTGTPGNIILNNTTGEYTLISGAYPADSFITTIESMLGQ